MTPIQHISSLLTSYRPHFAQADYSPAVRWLEAGCDLEKDILPELYRWTREKQDIRGLGFFTPYIHAARDRRLAEERVREQSPETDARRAKRIAFLTRKLGKRFPDEERWLAEYEHQHGKVAS